MQISPILWLAAAVGFLALEASTFNMTSIWFAIGSAAALLCCVFTGSFRVQAVVFLVVSILCLAAFRPLAASCGSNIPPPTATAIWDGRPLCSPLSPPKSPAGCGWTVWTGTPAVPPPATPLTPVRFAALPRSTAPCSS